MQGAWPPAGTCWSRDTLTLERTSKGHRPPGVPPRPWAGDGSGICSSHGPHDAPRFEINFLSEAGDIVFHIKPRFSSASIVANTFQGGRWGQEEVSTVFPLVLGEPFEVTGVGEAHGGGAPVVASGARCLVGGMLRSSRGPWWGGLTVGAYRSAG